jgi:hypothetical protein
MPGPFFRRSKFCTIASLRHPGADDFGRRKPKPYLVDTLLEGPSDGHIPQAVGAISFLACHGVLVERKRFLFLSPYFSPLPSVAGGQEKGRNERLRPKSLRTRSEI